MYVVLVCKSGGGYGPKNVQTLRRQIDSDIPIICLTDFDSDSPGLEDVEVRPLKHNWYGWWSKIEFFRDDLFYLDCLYFDLDVVVVDSVKDMTRPNFAMWVDPLGHGFNSSVMYKPRECPTKELYKEFCVNPTKYMQQYSIGNGMPWGDQAYIAKEATVLSSYKAPEVVSWKKDRHPEGAKVLVFHGQPKPYDAGYR